MRRRIFWGAISGVMMAAAFPRLRLDLLAWFCLVPFLLSIRNVRMRDGFAAGVAAGCAFFSLAVYWVTVSVHHYGGFSLVETFGALLILVLVLSLYFGLFGLIITTLRIPRVAQPFVTAAVWVSIEWLREQCFTGFPWASLGYSQVHRLAMIQVADLTAVYGVSFVIVAVNVAVAECVAGIVEEPRRIPWPAAAATLILVAATITYGTWRLDRLSRTTGPTLTVSLVQGNIEQDKKWDQRFQDETIGAYERLTARVVPEHPDLVIWPEAATPYFFGVEKPQTDRLLRMIARDRITLLFGSPAVAQGSSNELLYYNSAFAVGPDGAILGRYDKMHLVPFGEYVPLRQLLFFFHKLVDFVGDFIPGREAVVISTPKARIGVVICFEVVFPDLVRRFVAGGANVMTTITNDAWFGRTAAPYEHFDMAVFRSVENRVPLVRVANTGISGFIEATGRVHDTTPLFEEATRTATVVLRSGKSVYTRFGDVFAVACVIITVACWADSRRRKPL